MLRAGFLAARLILLNSLRAPAHSPRMHPLSRALFRRPTANRLPERWRHSLRTLRSCRHQENFLARVVAPARFHHVALRCRPPRSRARHSGGRFHAYAAQPRISRMSSSKTKASIPLARSKLAALCRGHHGPPLRLKETRHPFRRKCRWSSRGLRRLSQPLRSSHLHAQRCSPGEPHRVRLLWGARHAGRRPDLRRCPTKLPN